MKNYMIFIFLFIAFLNMQVSYISANSVTTADTILTNNYTSTDITSLKSDSDEESNMTMLKGHVYDSETGEELTGTNIYLENTNFGSTTNTTGYFQLDNLLPGAYTIKVSYLGYITHEEEVSINNNESHELAIYLDPRGYELDELTVTSDNTRQEHQNIGRRNVSMRHINSTPGVLQDDVFRSIQQLPGIAASSDFSSGLHIRGGSPDQTLIQLDQATIYNPNHFFGFYSTFNSDALQGVDLYKGTYPAKFGGRLGSVVDIQSREGDRDKHGGNLSFGMLASRAMLEGPTSENGSYMVAYRRSTIEPVLGVLRSEDIEGVPDNFHFYDLNARVTHTLNEKNRLSAGFYSGSDIVGFPFDPDTFYDLSYGNRAFHASWTHLANSDFYTDVRVTGSHYFSSPSTDLGGTTYQRSNIINDLNLSAKAEWYASSNFQISAGFKGGRISSSLTDKLDSRATLSTDIDSWNASAFIQNEWRPTPKWKINAGLRTQYFSSGDHLRFSPQVSIDRFITPQLRLQAAYGRYYQFMTMVSNGTLAGFDVWLLTDEEVNPSYSDQFALGAKYSLPENWTFELEGYYRNMGDLFELDPYRGDIVGFDYNELFRFGDGFAYGAEAMIERTSGRLNGFLAYTYGQTWRRFPGFNQDQYFPARYDRTHDITAVLNFEVSDKWKLSSTFTYKTGQAYTKPLGRAGLSTNPIEFERRTNLMVGKVNASRMPDYHRLDIAATRNGNLFNVADTELQLQIVNVYSRRNIWFYDYNFSNSVPQKEDMPLLPILPSVTYTLKF